MRINAKRLIKDYHESPLLTRAQTIHRTHKNIKMVIPKGNYLYDIYKDRNPNIVIKKASQCRISEWLIARLFYRAELGKSILYILPTFDVKNQFVRERIDKTIAYTIYYRCKMADGRKAAESTSLKQMGTGSVAFVGSNTPNAFISFPADDIIIDEYDFCDSDNIKMAEERQGASVDKTTIYVGNASISGLGIDQKFNESDSDKKEWFVKCNRCGKWVQPDFFKHIVRHEGEYDIILDNAWDKQSAPGPRPICEHCKKPFDSHLSGEWIAQQKGDISGYHISKMFSTSTTAKELVDRYVEGLSNDMVMQRFYNADLGLAYTAAGSRIGIGLIKDCIADYIMPETCTGTTIMGVDVGSRLHVIILELLPEGFKRLVYTGAISGDDSDKQVEYLYRQYHCKLGVIDALPETRLSKKLCTRLIGMFMCRYQHKIKATVDPKAKIVSVDRTETIDKVKETFFKKELLLPRNIESVPEFCEHIMSSTRILNERTKEYQWVESGPDHLLHALGYALLAEKLIKMI
jgi:hypothetical protein